MTPRPLLLLSDSVDLPTGLARITGDLKRKIRAHIPNVYVGSLGRGGLGGDSSWVIPHTTIGQGWSEWGISVIERVWRDFAGDQHGVLMTVWDATRLLPYACPKYLPVGPTRDFLTKRPFRLWGYFPVDGNCEDGGLGQVARETLEGFDRLLAYGKYGRDVLGTTRPKDNQCVQHLPHGIDTDMFRPRDRSIWRDKYSIPENAYLIGIVMTNQARKDWGLAARVCAALRKWIPRLRLWWHVDVLERYWSIPALLHQYGLGDITVVSERAEDDWLAHAYSACDLTLLPSLGEGFGYPIVESQACGVPCVHINYAGGAELTDLRVEPVAWRVDGLTNILRPVFDMESWVNMVMKVHDIARHDIPNMAESWRTRAMAYSWEKVWPKWEEWFRAGLEGL